MEHSGVYFFKDAKDVVQLNWTDDLETSLRIANAGSRKWECICFLPNVPGCKIQELRERFWTKDGRRNRGQHLPLTEALQTFIADTNAAILYIGALYVALLNLKGQCNGRHI